MEQTRSPQGLPPERRQHVSERDPHLLGGRGSVLQFPEHESIGVDSLFALPRGHLRLRQRQCLGPDANEDPAAHRTLELARGKLAHKYEETKKELLKIEERLLFPAVRERDPQARATARAVRRIDAA